MDNNDIVGLLSGLEADDFAFDMMQDQDDQIQLPETRRRHSTQSPDRDDGKLRL